VHLPHVYVFAFSCTLSLLRTLSSVRFLSHRSLATRADKGLVKTMASEPTKNEPQAIQLSKLLDVVRELMEEAPDAEAQAELKAVITTLTGAHQPHSPSGGAIAALSCASSLAGSTDQHSQAAAIFVLLCPRVLDKLRQCKELSREYTILRILGMAWQARRRRSNQQ
jgi:hypothetical protein